MLSGKTVAAVISRIDADGSIAGEGVPERLDLDGLRRIERPADSTAMLAPAVVVHLAGGGQIRARAATVTEERCQVIWSLSQRFSIPLDAVLAIRLDQAAGRETFQQALDNPPEEHDCLLVKAGEKIHTVSGLVEQLTEQRLVFQWENERRTLPRDKLIGIVLAQLGSPGGGPAKCTVLLCDGSRLPGNIALLEDGVLRFQLPWATSLQLPWQAVRQVHVRSRRMAFLSDLQPIEDFQQPLVTLSRPWQRDRSILGRPLSLSSGDGAARRSFDKGLGTHSRCRLTFDIDGQYDVLAATIGIDAETNGRGNCIFAVLADGEPLYRQQVKGTDPPRDLQLEIRGVRRLTLLVEPGEDLDLADHADWCDARVIRETKHKSP